jgi:hypothetical protein
VIIYTPATKIMADSMETSVSVNGVPGAIDSNSTSTETITTAKRKLLFVQPNDDLDESREENEFTPQPSQPKKARVRPDERSKFTIPATTTSKLETLREELLTHEVARVKEQRVLTQFKTYKTKLQIIALEKSLSSEEIEKALQLTIADEDAFLSDI